MTTILFVFTMYGQVMAFQVPDMMTCERVAVSVQSIAGVVGTRCVERFDV